MPCLPGNATRSTDIAGTRRRLLSTELGLRGQGGHQLLGLGRRGAVRGDLRVVRGAGRYAHLADDSLCIAGTIQRGSYALQATATGDLML
jgi:hypothetical protein